MKSSTLLDFAIFQLTPTRTRYDLIITASKNSEKIASGLLSPFLAHLKTAQDQIAKGGYSVLLDPRPRDDTTWFTKGTVQNFVRFVSTPEILERVHTIESEILQIEEAIVTQGSSTTPLRNVEDCRAKRVKFNEGNKATTYDNEENSIVLYESDLHTAEANGSTAHEVNPKLQLLNVLETRKIVLQKEQDMAFARAVAAGFDIDNVTPLLPFAECFGASRLRDACLRFINLWKKRHEPGQSLDNEAAESFSNSASFSLMHTSGVVLSSGINKPSGDFAPNNTDERYHSNHQVATSQQEFVQSHFSHPMFPPWAMQSPPGTIPVFQPYPAEGIPYYTNYPGNGHSYQPPYGAAGDSQFHVSDMHAVGSRDYNVELEARDISASKSRCRGSSESPVRGKRASRSDEKQTGKVVIQNINFVARKRQDSSGTESQSASDSDTEKGVRDSHTSSLDLVCQNSSSSKKKEKHGRSISSHDKKDCGDYVDGGNWQAFQNLLLRDADERLDSANQGMFASEQTKIKRKSTNRGDDPSAVGIGGPNEIQEGCGTELQQVSGQMTRILRTPGDEVFMYKGEGHDHGNGRGYPYNHMDAQFTEQNRYMHAKNNLHQSSPQDLTDEPFMIPSRLMSFDQGSSNRTPVSMDSEFVVQKETRGSKRTSDYVNYEPNDLSLTREHAHQRKTIGYDPALDHEMQVHPKDHGNKEEGADLMQKSMKSDKNLKTKVDAVDRKKTSGPIRKGKPSKPGPLNDVRARAESIRSYKADLQKLRKEKEEEDRKRLDALKIERQKRIALRGNSSIKAKSLSSPPTKKDMSAKMSLSSHKGSKFSDSEPGPSSPLQRSKIRTSSVGSSESLKNSKTKSYRNQSPGNRLTRSVPSLLEPTNDSSGVTSNSKVDMARIRRLSEPKVASNSYVAEKRLSIKLESSTKAFNEPGNRKRVDITAPHRVKASTLPELKVRAARGPLVGGRNKSAPREITLARKIDFSEAVELNSNGKKHTEEDDPEDNPVVEKMVVMLECEKPTNTSVPPAEEISGVHRRCFSNYEMVSEHAVTHSSALHMDGEPNQTNTQEQETGLVSRSVEKQPPRTSVSPTEIASHASNARVSFFKDLSSQSSENGKSPSTSVRTVQTGAEMVKTQTSALKNLKLEKIPEISEKPVVKNSPKGIKRLLNFGWKNQGAAVGERSIESDSAISDNSEMKESTRTLASSSEVHTLRNLISKDKAPSAESTPQKHSRNFSIFSPFRSKSSEKKSKT